MRKSEKEIRDEIARLEALVPKLKRQYEKTSVYIKTEALRWVLGEDDQ